MNLRSFGRLGVWLIAALSLPLLFAAEPTGPRRYSQKPEVAAANERVAPRAPASGEVKKTEIALETGPTPKWIWGADANRNYFLRKLFPGGAQHARLLASCDNRMTLWLNGQEIARSDSWQTAVEVDVQKYLREGQNELLAEVRNEGGSAGFVLKLAMRMPDGSTQYLVTDDSWTAAAEKNVDSAIRARALASLGAEPWGNVFANTTTQVNRGQFEVPPGFRVEKLFTVPKEALGSWVNIAFDPKGRLIASDQENKGLCRVTPPAIGSSEPTVVEQLEVKISAAQGMLFAFDSFYLSVNGGPGSGLYRLRDTTGNDQYDELVQLRPLRGGGEHGPHALQLSPDGKSIYHICGNHTEPPEDITSRIPKNWNEDQLLPRQWDANGHAVGRLAPGGWISRMDPEARSYEIVSMGYRNAFDFAVNADGELFAYDADMEWDMGAPWYRPTRVVHATSGSEFGWRSGTGKWPAYYVDSLPEMINIGPGSPVGVTFGYGTRFPARYQKALYILDWTFGTIYALHLEPDGASYKATKEEFVSRTPLPLTDAAVGPDGALYFAIGGRGIQSELFRVTYVGQEPTEPVDARNSRFADLRALRRELEGYHAPQPDPGVAVEFAWPHLSHADRFIRYAARIAIEQQPVAAWREQALAERQPETLIQAAVALARQGDSTDQPRLLAALDQLNFLALSERQQLDLLRAWSLVFIRLGQPDPQTAETLASQLDRYYPAASDPLNRELCNLLVYLQSPTVVSQTIELMKQPHEARPDATMTALLARNPGYGSAISQMLANQPDAQKLHYALALRNAKVGWNLEQRKFYFQWLQEASTKKGGASYPGFVRNIDKEAFENASEAERLAIEASGARKPYQIPELPKPQGPGRDWTLDELLALSAEKLKARDYKNGQKMYAAARCIICHRFAGDGGATGPDLTQTAGRFSLKDICEAIVDPSKVVSDQYRASVMETADGKLYTGRLLNESPQGVTLLTDPEDPTKQVTVPRADVVELKPSPVSLMPKDLLKPLNEQEVLDLLAYILSRGNPGDPMFRK